MEVVGEKTKEKKLSRSRRRAPPFGLRQAGNSCVWANEAACSRSQSTSWLRHGPAGGGGESAKPCVQSSCRAGGGRMGAGSGGQSPVFFAPAAARSVHGLLATNKARRPKIESYIFE